MPVFAVIATALLLFFSIAVWFAPNWLGSRLGAMSAGYLWFIRLFSLLLLLIFAFFALRYFWA